MNKLIEILTELVYEELIEAKYDALLQKYPELQPAIDAGITKVDYLSWMVKRSNEEPIEDLIGLVQSFDKNKQRLKSQGKNVDINSYKTVNDLVHALEGNFDGQSNVIVQQTNDQITAETDVLGQFGEWYLVMPHTIESSCHWGKGTTWCTARTKSQNLFLNYVARGYENIVLYYLIYVTKDKNKIVNGYNDPKKNPNNRLSVGFVDGQPILDGKNGHVSVNAANEGLTKDSLQKILDNEYESIMQTMIKHAGGIKGKHPAKKQMERAAQDVNLLRSIVEPMKSDNRIDFLKQLMEYKLSKEVLLYLSGDEDEIREAVAKNPSTPRETLMKLSGDRWGRVREAVAKNRSTPREALMKLSGDEDGIREAVAYNPSTPRETLMKLSGDKERIRKGVAKNPSTPKEILIKLSGDNEYIRKAVAYNPSTPREVLIKLSGDEFPIRLGVAYNPSTPREILIKLSGDDEYYIREKAIQRLKELDNKKELQEIKRLQKLAGII